MKPSAYIQRKAAVLYSLRGGELCANYGDVNSFRLFKIKLKIVFLTLKQEALFYFKRYINIYMYIYIYIYIYIYSLAAFVMKSTATQLWLSVLMQPQKALGPLYAALIGR